MIEHINLGNLMLKKTAVAHDAAARASAAEVTRIVSDDRSIMPMKYKVAQLAFFNNVTHL